MTIAIGLQHQLGVALPNLSFQARAIVDALQLGGGRIASATRVAQLLGLSSRFALGRMLRRDGLPGLRELAAWISIFGWVIVAERSKASLFAIATHSGRTPAVCYRTVRRLTGLTWVKVKARGFRWVLRVFVLKCQAISCKPPTLRLPHRDSARNRHPWEPNSGTSGPGWKR